MGIAADAHRRGLGQPGMALPEHDAMPLRLAHQDLDRLQVKPAVGRMGDRLRLHSIVDGDPLQRTGLGSPGIERHLDARLQHFLQTLRPDPLAPACHRAGVDRRLVLEELEAAEVLQLRIFHPTLRHLLVRQVVDVLEIMQSDHQPRRLGRPADRAVEAAKRLIELRPRHQLQQLDQRVPHVDDRVQAFAEDRSCRMTLGMEASHKHRKSKGSDSISGIFRYFKPLGNPRQTRLSPIFQTDYRGLGQPLRGNCGGRPPRRRARRTRMFRKGGGANVGATREVYEHQPPFARVAPGQ